jgi:hypothetical protein
LEFVSVGALRILSLRRRAFRHGQLILINVQAAGSAMVSLGLLGRSAGGPVAGSAI